MTDSESTESPAPGYGRRRTRTAWKGHRRGIKSTPTTSKRSARTIRARQREAETLKLRLQNKSYAAIGKITGVTTSTAERDLISALGRLVPRETADKALALELSRLDAMAAGHYAQAVKGSVAHSHCMLRIVELRCRLHGLLDRDQAAAARLTINSGGDRSMSISFVVPGSNGRFISMDANMDRIETPLEQERARHERLEQQVQKLRIDPSPDDIVLEKTMPTAMKKGGYGGYD